MISIVGSGKIGANVAVHLAMKGYDDLTLVDVVKGLPQGEAMDITHMLSAYGAETRVVGSNDYGALKGSKLVIVAAGFGRKPGQTRLDLMNSNAGIIKDVSEQVKRNAPDAVLLMVTNPLDVMTYVAYRVTGFDRHRVLGMSGTLDGSRLRHFVAEGLGVARSSVTPMIIGEHGDSMVPIPEYTTVGGVPASRLFSPDKFEGVVKNTREVAAEVIARKGATIHGPAAAVTVLVDAIVNDKKAVFNASTYLNGEYGFSGIVMDVPMVIGKGGVERILEIALTDLERSALNTSYSTLKEAISKLQIELPPLPDSNR
ncbi:MAG: malate dehydrogenase [Nitrososphaerota archaeon]|jgi:malate dehydrogenase|nr:malate dehydrogenase [Nitrososphaerota archaeon]MDG6942333.1 malate dehydrogenase [Nitrososphaerota archaeon]MDG6942799.1 malate dehydrogenase [Nitrososphaerota archaeon]MDG6948586.1 malate dehydrogenase [Nitrososphaerota archaeon]MDG6950512.1 malate dehydrogenase [Nitrososphaerota archaeon]